MQCYIPHLITEVNKIRECRFTYRQSGHMNIIIASYMYISQWNKIVAFLKFLTSFPISGVAKADSLLKEKRKSR